MATTNAAEQLDNFSKPAETNEAKLTSKTVDILGIKEISGEVEMRGQKVIFPLEETLTPSARFIDGSVSRIDRNRFVDDSAGAKKDLENITAQTKKEVSDMAQFLELLRSNMGNFKIIDISAGSEVRLNGLQSQPTETFLRDQGIVIKGADLVLLSNKTNIEDYMNLKRYGFDVDPIQAGTTGSGENTGVKLTYTLADGNKETILIAFTNTGKPEQKNDVRPEPEAMQEAKVINLDEERAKKEAEEKEKADDAAKGLV
jgi:hypothetical protein